MRFCQASKGSVGRWFRQTPCFRLIRLNSKDRPIKMSSPQLFLHVAASQVSNVGTSAACKSARAELPNLHHHESREPHFPSTCVNTEHVMTFVLSSSSQRCCYFFYLLCFVSNDLIWLFEFLSQFFPKRKQHVVTNYVIPNKSMSSSVLLLFFRATSG